MRTKTLLAAAVLAAGLATSMAQSNVYSLNVVGYVNVNLATGFNLVADQLALNGAGSNNTVHSVFGTSLVGSVYSFAGGTFGPAATYTTKGGWSGGTNEANVALRPGGGVFIQVAAPTTVTFVGEVPQGSLSTPYISGFNIAGSQVPQAGQLQADLGYVPNGGDTIFQYNSGTQQYLPSTTYTTKGGWPGGVQPNIAVGEAFWLQAATSGSWVRNFSVQ